MKYIIILPAIDEETTSNCLNSIDPEIRKSVVLVDNSGHKIAKKFRFEVGDSIRTKENMGVARAWNIGAKIVLEENLDYLIIISATMLFNDGMRDFIAKLELNNNKYGLETQHGWHCIAIGRSTFEKIGFFDENFYPAYYEDSDYIRRMELAGIHNPMSSTARLPKVDIRAGFAGNAHGIRKAKINVNMGACRQYFIDKWGYEPRYDSQFYRDLLYKYPFNDPDQPLSFWLMKTIEQLKKEYGLESVDTE